jgi:hypothetical protein
MLTLHTPVLTLKDATCPYMFFVHFSEQTMSLALHNINRLVLYDRGGRYFLRGTH